MAIQKTTIHEVKPKHKRKGIHSKSKSSSIKASKHYQKAYRGQGR